MSSQASTYLKFGGVTAIILVLLGYLAYSGVQDSKSYYVTIKELHKMGDDAYSKRLRVAGNVQPGSIKRTGTHVQFVLMEEDQTLHVDYTGTRLRLTRSKMIHRPWPMDDSTVTAFFMPNNCRQNARPSMPRSRVQLQAPRHPPSPPRA